MSNQILQQFKGQQVRIVQADGQPWFLLADLCAVLELGNPSQVARRLDADELNTLTLTEGIQRGNPVRLAVNESGLYAVILRSDKPQAREFRKWVTNEVLPALRQTGSYGVDQVAPTPGVNLASLQQMADLIPQAIEARVRVAQAEIVAEMDERFAAAPINSLQKGEIYNAVRALGKLMGGKPRDYAKAWAVFKDRYSLAGYADLPSRNFDDAMRFIRDMAAAYEGPQQALAFGSA